MFVYDYGDPMVDQAAVKDKNRFSVNGVKLAQVDVHVLDVLVIILKQTEWKEEHWVENILVFI